MSESDLALQNDKGDIMISFRHIKSLSSPFLALAISCFLSVMFCGVTSVCMAGLLGHWKLDEGSGDVFHDSAGGNHGELFDVPIEWVTDAPPVQNFAVSFSGDDTGIVTDFEGIGEDNPRTITFWMKTDVPDDEPSHRIVAWGATSDTEKWHTRVNNNAGNGVLGAIRTEVQGGQNVATTPVNDNEWHHIAVVFPDGGVFNSDVMHYVDGEFDPQSGGGDQDVFTRIGPDAEPVSMGMGYQGANATFYPGLLADVRIYDEALDENVIRSIMAGEGLAKLLQAGDADQDLDFDQLDLVKVQIAAKYLTGQAATWGEGDWDGAPGGQQGNPPAGNGLFDQLDIITALAGNKYLTGPYAALSGPGKLGDEQASLVYDTATGELSVDSPVSKNLTSINITSVSNRFIGDKPAVLDGAFDNFSTDNLFKATFGGSFGDISFGNVLPSGLSESEVSSDLSAVGSLAGGGDLGNVDLVYIPEPSAVMLIVIGFLAIIIRMR